MVFGLPMEKAKCSLQIQPMPRSWGSAKRNWRAERRNSFWMKRFFPILSFWRLSGKKSRFQKSATIITRGWRFWLRPHPFSMMSEMSNMYLTMSGISQPSMNSRTVWRARIRLSSSSPANWRACGSAWVRGPLLQTARRSTKLLHWHSGWPHLMEPPYWFWVNPERERKLFLNWL